MQFFSHNNGSPQPIVDPNSPTPTTPIAAMASRSPIDPMTGAVRGSFDPMRKVAGVMQRIDAARSYDLVRAPAQHPSAQQASLPPSPAAMPPGAYARAVRGGMYTPVAQQAPQWRPDAVIRTGVIHPMWVRMRNPVEMARHTIDPFLSSVRPMGPGITAPGYPPPWVRYRQYTPMPSPTAVYSPSVDAAPVGTVGPAARSGW